LAPSINDGWEVGLKFKPLQWLEGRIAYWEQVASDEVRRKLNDPTGDFDNVGRTRRDGVDVQFNAVPIKPLSLWVAGSVQNAKVLKPGGTEPQLRGKEIDLVEINFSWYIDDLPPMMFIKASPNSHGFVNPHDVEQLWRDQFDWVYREYDYAIFPITIHPDVSGRPQVLLMLERLFDHIQRHPGVTFEKFEDVASDFRRRFPFKDNKQYPFDRDMP
jgi:hypothetical protein